MKEKTTWLALDLGTTTGFAIKDRQDNITSGWVSFKSRRFEGGGMRFLRFKNWLEELKENINTINAIYFEEVRRHLGTDASHIYGGLLAMLTAWCESESIPYEGIPVGTIKKHVTGKGNASKAEVIKAINDLGVVDKKVTDDNEADALAILNLVMSQSNM